jgi:hypothetical protein
MAKPFSPYGWASTGVPESARDAARTAFTDKIAAVKKEQAQQPSEEQPKQPGDVVVVEEGLAGNAFQRAQTWIHNTTKGAGAATSESYYTTRRSRLMQNAPPVTNAFLSSASKQGLETSQRQIFSRERGCPARLATRHPQSSVKVDERDFVRWWLA